MASVSLPSTPSLPVRPGGVREESAKAPPRLGVRSIAKSIRAMETGLIRRRSVGIFRLQMFLDFGARAPKSSKLLARIISELVAAVLRAWLRGIPVGQQPFRF